MIICSFERLCWHEILEKISFLNICYNWASIIFHYWHLFSYLWTCSCSAICKFFFMLYASSYLCYMYVLFYLGNVHKLRDQVTSRIPCYARQISKYACSRMAPGDVVCERSHIRLIVFRKSLVRLHRRKRFVRQHTRRQSYVIRKKILRKCGVGSVWNKSLLRLFLRMFRTTRRPLTKPRQDQNSRFFEAFP